MFLFCLLKSAYDLGIYYLALQYLKMFLSVWFSLSVVSDSLQPHGLQLATLPCLSLSELTQTHLHPVGDAIQPSYPLSSLFPPAFNLSQHQGLFQGVSSSHHVARDLEFQISFKTDGLISFQSKVLSRVFSNTTVHKHQFFSAQLSLQSNSHIRT